MRRIKKKYFDRSHKKEGYPEKCENKVVSNNVKYFRSSKTMGLTCLGEEKVRFNKWF